MNFHERLRSLRNNRGITQSDLAEAIFTTTPNISSWENGRYLPGKDALQRIADYFNVSVDYLLGRTDIPLPTIDIDELGENPCPLIGQVVAGVPIEAQENMEGYIYIKYKPANEYFALRVHGNSMINAGIPEGAVIVVHKQNYADNRQIVVALLNGEHTIKRFIRQSDDVILLQPENPTMSPIVVTKKDTLLILGVVKEIRIEV